MLTLSGLNSNFRVMGLPPLNADLDDAMITIICFVLAFAAMILWTIGRANWKRDYILICHGCGIFLIVFFWFAWRGHDYSTEYLSKTWLRVVLGLLFNVRLEMSWRYPQP